MSLLDNCTLGESVTMCGQTTRIRWESNTLATAGCPGKTPFWKEVCSTHWDFQFVICLHGHRMTACANLIENCGTWKVAEKIGGFSVSKVVQYIVVLISCIILPSSVLLTTMEALWFFENILRSTSHWLDEILNQNEQHCSPRFCLWYSKHSLVDFKVQWLLRMKNDPIF